MFLFSSFPNLKIGLAADLIRNKWNIMFNFNNILQRLKKPHRRGRCRTTGNVCTCERETCPLTLKF